MLITHMKRICSVSILALSVTIAPGAYADEADDGNLGIALESGSAEVPQISPFDESANFIPPTELDLQDVPLAESLAANDEVILEDFETISITEAGVEETIALTGEDLEIFKQAIAVMEDSGIEDEGEVSDAGFEPEIVIPESVIGTDTRIRVHSTTKFPWRAVGRIDIGCTGTLVGPRHVLTAGHCVYNTRTDKWYSALSFSPGQSGNVRPKGKIGWSRALSVKGWTKNHKRNFDYGMIILKKDIGRETGWMGYGWKKPMPKYTVNINGYPGDKPRGTMWHSNCKMSIVTSHRIYYPCDTAGGMSGSGTYVYFSSTKKRTIYGIHAYGVDGTGHNGATRIRKPVFEVIKKWKANY